MGPCSVYSSCFICYLSSAIVTPRVLIISFNQGNIDTVHTDPQHVDNTGSNEFDAKTRYHSSDADIFSLDPYTVVQCSGTHTYINRNLKMQSVLWTVMWNV